jgi:hypothetical protein
MAPGLESAAPALCPRPEGVHFRVVFGAATGGWIRKEITDGV